MAVLQLIDEVEQRVPVGAPFGTRWKVTARVAAPDGPHVVAVAARIDDKGRRREQFLCDGLRVERHVLLRLACPEAECPQARAVRTQWADFHHRRPASAPTERLRAMPLIEEVPVVAGTHHCTARPAHFRCYTPCPNGAHPPMVMDKTGYDLFEDGVYLGGGVAKTGCVTRPRLPSVRAVEAFLLARHLETLAALGRLRLSWGDGGESSGTTGSGKFGD